MQSAIADLVVLCGYRELNVLALKPWIDLELPETVDTALTKVCFLSVNYWSLLCNDCLFVCMSVCPSIHLIICLYMCVSLSVCVCLQSLLCSLSLSPCLSVCLRSLSVCTVCMGEFKTKHKASVVTRYICVLLAFVGSIRKVMCLKVPLTVFYLILLQLGKPL